MIRVPLKEISKQISSGITPLRSNNNFWNSEDVPWVKTEQLGKKNIYNSNEKISFAALKQTSLKLNPINTLSIAMYGEGKTRGSVSILKTEMTTNQACCNIVVDEDIAYYEYVYYYLTTQYHQLRNLSSGVRKNLNTNDIKNFDIRLPENIQTQKSIAKVLSDLDAKIELNNKINQELEAMAKTLYDYWFVQFEFPSVASAEDGFPSQGKPYKSSGGKMVYNEELKREVPEGWEVKKIKDFAETGSGGTPLKSKKEFYDGGNIPWINSGEVNEPFIVSAKKYITQVGLDNSSAKIFKKGTVLMAMYGATAGQVSFMDIEACTNQAICAINPKEDYYRTFTKLGLEDLYKYLVNLSSGSARDNLSQDKIRELKFVIPNNNLIEKFDKAVSPSMEKILINLKQNQQLTALQDWLLPMLVNGQVTVALREPQGSDIAMAAEPSVEYKKGN